MDVSVATYPALYDEKQKNHRSDLLIDPVENVEAIFRLRPPFYHTPKKGSKSTRKPALYDQHLAGALLLRKTVFSPNLPEKLGMVAKDALQKATLPPSGHGLSWLPASEIERNVRKDTSGSGKNCGEPDVAKAYQNLFTYIGHIASVLLFPSSSWNTQFLELSISDTVDVGTDSDRGKRNKYAIPDAILRINAHEHDLDIPSQSHILEDIDITANYFKRVVPFEFKSLSSGSYQTMLGILGHTLLDIFPWQGCGPDCAYEHGPKLGRKPVTGDPLGFDAVISGVDLDISTWDGISREAFRAMSNKDHKIYKGYGTDILQQIWAEMVKCDSTYSVLHAGKYELLFFRDRRNQTLHISDVFEPHSVGQETPGGPGYYQIHIGLYISAIQDAINRARLLRDFGGDAETLPDMWTRPYDLGFGKYNPDPTPKLPFHDILCKYMDLCLAPARNESRSFNYVSNKPYRRSTLPVGDEEKFFFLETRDHTSPNELIGFLYVGEHTYQSWPVVIKVASGQNATKQLYKEYRNHTDLTAKRKPDVMVQKAYGLFTRGGKMNAQSILLLEYVGKPVPVERLKCLTSRQQLAIQKTLWLLYKKGFVHGALSRRCIFMDDGPDAHKRHGRKAQLPWLINLGHIRSPEVDKEMRYERKRLRRWFKRDENDNSHRPPQPPSHPIELGPIPFKVENAKAAFDRLTSWMSQEPWLQTVDCSIKEGALSDGAWLVVKFFSSEAVAQFQQEWKHRLPDLLETRYENTFFNQESRESSQALSPPSGLDSEESSQASSQTSSAMVIS